MKIKNSAWGFIDNPEGIVTSATASDKTKEVWDWHNKKKKNPDKVVRLYSARDIEKLVLQFGVVDVRLLDKIRTLE